MDAELALHAKEGERLDLYHIGRSALVLHHGFPLSTRDIDIIRLRSSPLEERMIEQFGENSPAAKELGLYIDAVSSGFPPVPHWFRSRSVEIPGDWKVLRLWKLEAHDLDATKLKRFHTSDREDLQMMCDRELLDSTKLRKSLEAAYPYSLPGKDDDDDPDRVRAFKNLGRVEAYLRGDVASI